MPSEPSILPIPEHEKDLLRNLMQAYRRDMSEFDSSDPDERGSFGVGHYFDVYWTEPTRYPFKVVVGNALVGFALVHELGPKTYSIAEFFILRRHRRRGIGRTVAFALFDKFPGKWHIGQDEHKVAAQRFWRTVVGEYSDGAYTEGWSESQPRGPEQVFFAGGVQ